MAEQRKAVIKNADMSEPMQQDAVDVASIALSKYNIEKVRPRYIIQRHLRFFFFHISLSIFGFFFQQDVAAYIKKEFDKKYNPTWYVLFFFLNHGLALDSCCLIILTRYLQTPIPL